jgi:heme exporter protein D
VENPFIHRFVAGYSHTQEVWLAVGITLVLISLLGAVFLKAFRKLSALLSQSS